MAVATHVILQGNIARVSHREFTSKTTGEVGRITSALVVGDKCIGQVRIPDSSVPLVHVGNPATWLVSVSTYRDDDQLELVEDLGTPGKG